MARKTCPKCKSGKVIDVSVSVMETNKRYRIYEEGGLVFLNVSYACLNCGADFE